MKKSLVILCSVCLSSLLTSCLKSNGPVIFDGYQVSPAAVQGLGSVLAPIDESSENVSKAFQLRTVNGRTYLYACKNRNTTEPEKIQAYVSAIPNQPGLYTLSLEVGNFFYEDNYANSFFHELFLLQPLADKMVVRVMSSSDGDTISSYFRNISKPSLATEYGADAYAAEQIERFLINYADEYIEESEADTNAYNSSHTSEYAYYDLTLDRCAWN